jgi:TonB family protein
MFIGAWLLFLPLGEGHSQDQDYIILREKLIRERASRTFLPDYPPLAKKHRATGVVVAEVEIDQTGHVANVKILQAPDLSIETAVTKVVRQWEFKVTIIDGSPVRIKSKLTFYYALENGNFRVNNPRQFKSN